MPSVEVAAAAIEVTVQRHWWREGCSKCSLLTLILPRGRKCRTEWIQGMAVVHTITTVKQGQE
jgi:hypothetical protein